jgi:hypothetical protein
VYKVTLLQLVFNADNPSMTAVNSIRLFVVNRTPPDSSIVLPGVDKIAAQPPFPGLPKQQPSV